MKQYRTFLVACILMMCAFANGQNVWSPYGARYAIIVMGGNVDTSTQLYKWYWGDSYGMYTLLVNHGFTRENLYFLSYGPSAVNHPEAVDAVSSKSNIESAYRWAKQVCKPEDLLYIFWVDHGSLDGFETNNGPMSHAQIGSLMDSIVCKRIIGAYNPCYSGAIIDNVSRKGVISITSVDPHTLNSWGWAGKWKDALAGGSTSNPSDRNGDGYVSMTEAYQWIAPQSQSAGENSMFDDNGDKTGSQLGQSRFNPDESFADGYDGKYYSLDGWMNVNVSVEDGNNIGSEGLQLFQNYPNPFSMITRIPVNGQGILEVRDVLGRVIYQTNVNNGQTEFTFNGSALSNGLYEYLLSDGVNVQSRMMMVAK